MFIETTTESAADGALLVFAVAARSFFAKVLDGLGARLDRATAAAFDLELLQAMVVGSPVDDTGAHARPVAVGDRPPTRHGRVPALRVAGRVPDVDVVFPPRLRPGSHLRVIAPARSRALVRDNDHSEIAESRLQGLGLTVSYGAHVDERDRYDSSSVASRLSDLHDAFADPHVDGVLTVIGGFNSNELLPGLDYDLIAANPKVLCGYSDITALQNAILARSGLVTYSGPHWSSFGMSELFDDTSRWFADAVMDSAPIQLHASTWFTDDLWFLDQHARMKHATEGWWNLQGGTAEGRIIGGNLCTLNLLQGTGYMPSLDGALLFVEDDELVDPVTFRRDLFSLLQLPDAAGVTGLVIGRFQRACRVGQQDLADLVAALPVLRGKPVLGNVDFGHTNPQVTFPIGGRARLTVDPDASLTITQH